MYIIVDPMLRQAFTGDALKNSLWALLALCLVLGYLYLTKVWHVTRNDQLAVSGAAFVVYVMAIGGPFTTIEGFKTIIGGILAAILTAFMAFLPAPVAPT